MDFDGAAQRSVNDWVLLWWSSNIVQSVKPFNQLLISRSHNLLFFSLSNVSVTNKKEGHLLVFLFLSLDRLLIAPFDLVLNYFHIFLLDQSVIYDLTLKV